MNLLFVMIACNAGTSGSKGVGVGEIAPDFELNDQNGAPVRLSDYEEQAVLLDFTEFW